MLSHRSKILILFLVLAQIDSQTNLFLHTNMFLIIKTLIYLRIGSRIIPQIDSIGLYSYSLFESVNVSVAYFNIIKFPNIMMSMTVYNPIIMRVL